MPIKLTTQQFIEKARLIHGDKYDYSKVNYINTKTKVCIICPIHGEFWQRPNGHLAGDGCPSCGRNVVKEKLSSSREDFIIKAKKLYGDKFDYSKVEYVNNNVKVLIHCNTCGNDFWQIPRSHLSGIAGCKKCADAEKALSKEEFIEKAKEIHGNKYDYSKVEYKNNRTKVCIICPEHGEFLITPASHLAGNGCRLCGLERRTKTAEQFIEEARKIHGYKYTYSKVNYINDKTKVLIHCNTCGGDFWQVPNAHLAGKGCNICCGTHLFTTEEFIEKAKQVHGDKYDYSKVEYKGYDIPVCIVCLEHGEFWQTPHHHLYGEGCPNCKESQGERKIKQFLAENNIEYIYNKQCIDCLKPLRPDFYLPDYNLVIEYDGKQHFKPINIFGGEEEFKKTQERDLLKEKICKENKINLLRIPYTEFNNIDNILKGKLIDD